MTTPQQRSSLDAMYQAVGFAFLDEFDAVLSMNGAFLDADTPSHPEPPLPYPNIELEMGAVTPEMGVQGRVAQGGSQSAVIVPFTLKMTNWDSNPTNSGNLYAFVSDVWAWLVNQRFDKGARPQGFIHPRMRSVPPQSIVAEWHSLQIGGVAGCDLSWTNIVELGYNAWLPDPEGDQKIQFGVKLADINRLHITVRDGNTEVVPAKIAWER